MKKNILYFICCMGAFSVFGQKSTPYQLSPPATVLSFEQQNNSQWLSEDAAQEKGRLRCAVLIPVNQQFPDNIKPDSIKDGFLWRMQLHAPNAEAINVYLEDFYLPAGAELAFYTPDYLYHLPVVSSLDNPENGIFVTDHLKGSDFIIELFLPQNIKKSKFFTIKDMGYMYRPFPDWLNHQRGFGSSQPCEVNVNCPEGSNWQQEKKGIARILLLSGGSLYYCTGSLINNTTKDRTPYFLTAEHCGEGTSDDEYKKWKFYFNYESVTCNTPSLEPSYIATTGAEKIAEGSYAAGSDFLLLKLKPEIASTPELFFNGWDISNSAPANGVTIHHPEGDIKKISTFQNPLGGDNTHWRVQWSQTETNWGVTEGGSSGSPIFDQNRLIVGTLTGGEAACNKQTGYDYYGKMYYHWNKNGALPLHQLKPWLDPYNTGITQLEGMAANESAVNEDNHNTLYLHPNPVEKTVSMEIKDADVHIIKIINIFGQCVFETKTMNGQKVIEIDMSRFSTGMYMVLVFNGKEYKTQKIIKK